MDRMLTSPQREIQGSLKKMKIVQNNKDSLLESFVQILRHCKKLKDLVEDSAFYDYLKANFKNQDRLKPIVAFFNLIYSSYTVDGEANIQELSDVLVDLRKNYPNLGTMDDIELFLFAISTSFRVMQMGMEEAKAHHLTFEEYLVEIFQIKLEIILKSPLLCNLIDLIYQDYAAFSKTDANVVGTEARLAILNQNMQSVTHMTQKLQNIPNISREFNYYVTQYNFNDEENKLFNLLVESYKKKLLDSFGTKALNLEIIKPIHIDFLPKLCSLMRYDLQNQVNFGYMNIKFEYMSFSKNLTCETTGLMAETSVKKEDADIHQLKSRISYTFKLTVKGENFEQVPETLKLPKIKNYLLKILEVDPGLDIINDYDVITFHQSRCPRNNTNFYRFVSIEERLTGLQVGNEQSSHFGLTFINEKRLTNQLALKIFYQPKFVKSTLLSDLNVSVYVSRDNDEDLHIFLDEVIKCHHLKDVMRQDQKDFMVTLIGNLVFYLPSSCESEEDITKWKEYSKKLELKPNTPLSAIYESLVKHSKIDLFNSSDPTSHMYMSCFINFEKTDVTIDKGQFNHSQFEKFDKKKQESIVLNTGISDILDYVLLNYKTTLDNLAAKGLPTPNPDPNTHALWRMFDKYPSKLFLPNFLVIRVFEVRKLLELGEHLEFYYIESKLKSLGEPISNQYNIIGLICQKKQAKSSDPLVYYPIIKEKENRFDFKYRGFLGEKEVVADIFKIDREQVHFIVFERREITF